MFNIAMVFSIFRSVSPGGLPASGLVQDIENKGVIRIRGNLLTAFHRLTDWSVSFIAFPVTVKSTAWRPAAVVVCVVRPISAPCLYASLPSAVLLAQPVFRFDMACTFAVKRGKGYQVVGEKSGWRVYGGAVAHILDDVAVIVAKYFPGLPVEHCCKAIVHVVNKQVARVRKDKTATTDMDARDVDIEDDTECWSGFMKINRMSLRHRLYAGGWSGTIHREVVHRAPGVGVLLYDPDLDKVLLVEQFRIGCLQSARGPWKLELVAGLIDTDESPEEVAVREVREEAGIDISRPMPFFDYYLSPGSSTETMSLFCAAFSAREHDSTDAGGEPRESDSIHGLDEENEDIRVVIMDRKEAEKAMGNGIIDNAMTIIALQWLKLNLGSVREQLKGNVADRD